MPDSQKTTCFVNDLIANQRRIYGYIASLLPNWADAEDVFQETCMLLWQKIDDYEPGSSFHAWAFRVAFNKILQHRQLEGKHALRYSAEFLEMVDKSLQVNAPAQDLRFKALADCFLKLRAEDQDLLHRRYQLGATTKQVASELGRSIHAIYRSLNRIHAILMECVKRNIEDAL